MSYNCFRTTVNIIQMVKNLRRIYLTRSPSPGHVTRVCDGRETRTYILVRRASSRRAINGVVYNRHTDIRRGRPKRACLSLRIRAAFFGRARGIARAVAVPGRCARRRLAVVAAASATRKRAVWPNWSNVRRADSHNSEAATREIIIVRDAARLMMSRESRDGRTSVFGEVRR